MLTRLLTVIALVASATLFPSPSLAIGAGAVNKAETCRVLDQEAFDEEVERAAAYDEEVERQAAYDEKVIDVEFVPGTSAVTRTIYIFKNDKNKIKESTDPTPPKDYTLDGTREEVVTPAVPEVAEISHVVHHPAVIETIHHPAVMETVHHEATFKEVPCTPKDEKDEKDVKNLKVWVCKNVQKPNSNEVEKTIINVSTSSLESFPTENVTFPHDFKDAQGSKAIGYSTGPNAIAEPSLADCPGGLVVEDPDPVKLKVWVCKFVKKPGPDEVAKTIINVSTSSLPGFIPGTSKFPYDFGDAQDSKALGYSTGPNAIAEPSLADCAGTPPDPDVVLMLWVCDTGGEPSPGGEPTLLAVLQQITNVLASDVPGFVPGTSEFPFLFTDGGASNRALGYSNGPDAIAEPSLADCFGTAPDETDPDDVNPVVANVEDQTVSNQTLPDTGGSTLWLLATGLLLVLAGTTMRAVGRHRK